MPSSKKPNVPPEATLSLADTLFIVSDVTRWKMLAILIDGHVHTVTELAKAVGRSADSISKHLREMRRLGVVKIERDRLYRITEPFRLPEGATELDFGYCTVRLQYAN